MSRALPCPCGDSICKNWHVSPEANVQGVRFTQSEAELVAEVMNFIDGRGTSDVSPIIRRMECLRQNKEESDRVGGKK